MNQFNGIGRLTRDPELKYTAGGTAVANCSIAINRKIKKEGQPDADFFNLIVWGKLGENIVKYQKKGSLLRVTGRMENRSWEKEGTKHTITEIIADDIEFLEKASSSNGAASNNSSSANNGASNNNFNSEYSEADSGDIPF